MNRNLKKGGGNLVFVLLCFNYSIYIYRLVILPNV